MSTSRVPRRRPPSALSMGVPFCTEGNVGWGPWRGKRRGWGIGCACHPEERSDEGPRCHPEERSDDGPRCHPEERSDEGPLCAEENERPSRSPCSSSGSQAHPVSALLAEDRSTG